MTMRVLKPGFLTTVQDLGRAGYQRQGVAAGGAMDPFAARVANMLAGNDANAAVLEMALVGPQLRFDDETLIAWCGADFDATLDGRPLPKDRPVCVARDGAVNFGAARHGARAWLAVAGGIAVPEVMGSRSTYLAAGIGGLDGRNLGAGDPLPPGPVQHHSEIMLQLLRNGGKTAVGWAVPPARLGVPGEPGVLRAMRGPEWDWFAAEARDVFFRDEFRVTKDSDRMGIRLAGPPLLPAAPREMISAAVNHGVVQVPASGQPIVLGADRQTIGGYPRIGAVAAVDFAGLAQLRPGDAVRFREITIAEAHELLFARERDFTGVCEQITTPHL